MKEDNTDQVVPTPNPGNDEFTISASTDRTWTFPDEANSQLICQKFYFITFQATSRKGGHVSIWNDVCDVSPMEYIRHVADVEKKGSNTYYDFVITFALPITPQEYSQYKDRF